MDSVVKATGCDGVMIARGALANPGIFSNNSIVPISCIGDYLRYALLYSNSNARFTHHLHHIAYMSSNYCTRADRRILQSIKSISGLIQFAREQLWIGENLFESTNTVNNQNNIVNTVL